MLITFMIAETQFYIMLFSSKKKYSAGNYTGFTIGALKDIKKHDLSDSKGLFSKVNDILKVQTLLHYLTLAESYQLSL